jgi:AcrR family transcriptional regulator
MPRNLSDHELEQFRAEVCEVAERLFAEQGFEGVSLRALSDALGVSRMTPYRYFRDKAEIFAAVRTAAYNRFAAAQEAVAAAESEPAARLLALGHSYVNFAVEQPHAYRLMFGLSQPDPGKHPELLEAGLRAALPLREAVASAVRSGVLEGDVESLSLGFWSGVHGLVSLHLSGHLAESASIDELATPLLRQLFHGGVARSSPQPEERRT